jgi:hypothetical protein
MQIETMQQVHIDPIQFNPIIQPPMVTHQFSFPLDGLTYEFDTSSGKVQCSGPWNPDYCFPRNFINFQGYLFSVDTLLRGDSLTGDVRSILIPSSVRVVGCDCFGSDLSEFLPYESLELVVFDPHSQLTDLRERAFMQCTSLQCIYLPRSVERISDFCFCGCITFSHFGFECGSTLNFIGAEAFFFCRELKSIVIPASVSRLADGAFLRSGIQNTSSVYIEAGNENLTIAGDSIVDLNGVQLVTYFGSSEMEVLSRDIEIINPQVFANPNLVDLSFEPGSKLSRILDLAFFQCTSLRSIHIPASVTTMSGSVFTYCNLENICIEAGNRHFQVIGKFLLDFHGKSLIRYFGSELAVRLLRQIEVLSNCCFDECDKIQKLSYEPNSLIQEFRRRVFKGCSALKAIFIPASVRKIDGSCFANSGICSIKADSSNFRTEHNFLLDSMGGLVRYFGSESRVTIPRSVLALRRYCFSSCEQLRQLLFEPESGLTDLEAWVFDRCTNLELIDLPASLVNVDGTTFADAKIAKISVAPGNPHLRILGDCLVDITRARLICYFGSSSVIVLSRAIEILGNYSLAYCHNLSSLTFEPGSKLIRIERAALVANPLLQSIVIPASVTSIVGNVFSASGIRHISVEKGNAHFCVVGEFLLDSTKTSLVAFFGTPVTVKIVREIRVICNSCFADFRIPSSIESLEREWFRESCIYAGGVVFDTVEFESAESLSKMITADSVDLSGDFDIDVLNWNGETHIPGYFVDKTLLGNAVRLKKSSLISE